MRKNLHADKTEPQTPPEVFCGLRVVMSEHMVVFCGIVDTPRPWRERLFSLPWRPWRATKAVPLYRPHPDWLATADGRLLVHPDTYAAACRVLAKQQLYPGLFGRA